MSTVYDPELTREHAQLLLARYERIYRDAPALIEARRRVLFNAGRRK